jgi:DNA primase
LEIYNQDQLLLDPEAVRQMGVFGLVLVEGFFDAAKLVEAGPQCRCINGARISVEQIERLAWIHHGSDSRIVLFLDRTKPVKGAGHLNSAPAQLR